ncbi:diguanylate cyclase [Marinicrinis sediminis]|uniref:Diguanylate cyclase n=1 Tax=Marinicrinis sediminis TaxID=1652465 RepID=A0ABW5R5Z0_9BACL
MVQITTTLILILIFIFVNTFRHLLAPSLCRLLFPVATMLFTILNLLWLDIEYLGVLLFLPIWACSAAYYFMGAALSSAISSLLIWGLCLIYPEQIHIEYAMTFTLASLLCALLVSRFYLKRQELQERKMGYHRMLYTKTKELNNLREISSAMQSTFDLPTLYHTILTVMTAGFGLGFNRAFLLLVSDDKKYLVGRLGIGSMSIREGLDKWANLIHHRIDLKDLIQLNHVQKDLELNDVVLSMKLPLHQAGIFTTALKKEQILHIQEWDESDRVQLMLKELFDIRDEFAVIPLITHHTSIGVIVVDNNIYHTPITHELLDSTIPFANQAAMAISNALTYQQTQEYAIKDGLTGLYNLRYYQSIFKQYCEAARSFRGRLAMLVLDIDYFKHYNDQNGHQNGNIVLTQFANALKTCLRSEDILFRFGGEEFVIVVPNCPEDELMKHAEFVRHTIDQTYFHNQETQPNQNLTVSIGIASYPAHCKEPEHLFEAADLALFKAKESGRNQIASYRRDQDG